MTQNGRVVREQRTQGRRLSSITKGNSTYSYEYDMSGVRSVKIVDGWKHEYVTQNGKVVRDKVTDASTGAFQYVLEFGYDESGRPLTLRWYYNEAETWYNTYYYICNAQGDVVKLVSDSGATIAAYSYDAWGTLLSIQGESNGDAFIAYANPLRYRGYYYDTETGFYYLQSRYYDPIVKRFLNADSYGSTGQGFLGYNMFAYCGNNPVNAADFSGHFPVLSTEEDSGIKSTWEKIKRIWKMIINTPGNTPEEILFQICYKNTYGNYYFEASGIVSEISINTIGKRTWLENEIESLGIGLIVAALCPGSWPEIVVTVLGDVAAHFILPDESDGIQVFTIVEWEWFNGAEPGSSSQWDHGYKHQYYIDYKNLTLKPAGSWWFERAPYGW